MLSLLWSHHPVCGYRLSRDCKLVVILNENGSLSISVTDSYGTVILLAAN